MERASRVEQAPAAYKLYARVEGWWRSSRVFADHALEEGKKLVNDPDLNADPAPMWSLCSPGVWTKPAEAFRADWNLGRLETRCRNRS